MTRPHTRSTHKFLQDRAILVGLPISDDLVADFKDALSQVCAAGSDPIMVYVNSPGGAVFASEKLAQLLGASGVEVRTCCLGYAAGSAAHIFALGSHRSAVADSLTSFIDFRSDDSGDMVQIAEIRRAFIERSSRALGVSAATIAQWMSEKRSFSGNDLITAGLVHSMI